MASFKEVRDELEGLIKAENLITIKEAADLRKVSRSAVLQLIQRGRLRTETVIGKTLIYKSDIENFEGQKPGPVRNSSNLFKST